MEYACIFSVGDSYLEALVHQISMHAEFAAEEVLGQVAFRQLFAVVPAVKGIEDVGVHRGRRQPLNALFFRGGRDDGPAERSERDSRRIVVALRQFVTG